MFTTSVPNFPESYITSLYAPPPQCSYGHKQNVASDKDAFEEHDVTVGVGVRTMSNLRISGDIDGFA